VPLRPIVSVFVLSCLLAAGACSRSAETADAPLVTDSAGVRIVHNTISQFERDGRAWHVTAEPRVVIGSPAGDEAYLFDRIMGVERLSDSRWAVADMGSSQIRYYDAGGRHLNSVGRAGEGPGEFRQVMGMFLLAGDTLAIEDSRSRVHLLDGAGNFVGMITSRSSLMEARTRPVGAFSDGTLLVGTFSATPQRLTEPHAMTLSYSRSHFERDGAHGVRMAMLDTIGTWESRRMVPGWRGWAQPIQFDVPILTQLMSDGIVAGDPATYALRLHGPDGALRTIVRREWTPVAVTEQDVETAQARFIDMLGEDDGRVPPSMLQQQADIAATWLIAEHMPAFRAIAVDVADNIWLRNYVPNEVTIGDWRPSPAGPTRWTVFSRDGILLGEVELPARFAPQVFGEDYVAGVYRDDVHVEYVHVYGIEKR
jgi:hypothetical protein